MDQHFLSGDERLAVFLTSLLLLTLTSPIRADSFLSVFAGPSISLMQDIKERTFDAQGNRTAVRVLGTETSLRFKEGVKLTHFFSNSLGIEGEVYHGQVLASIDTTGDGNVDTALKQDRFSFMMLLMFRQKINRNSISSIYGGLGTGMIYSNFERMGSEWDYGGQFLSGINFNLGRGRNFFFETKYMWAPDVGGGNESPGSHLKSSGNPKNNLATHIFGPHHDTQIVSFAFGARFQIGK